MASLIVKNSEISNIKINLKEQFTLLEKKVNDLKKDTEKDKGL